MIPKSIIIVLKRNILILYEILKYRIKYFKQRSFKLLSSTNTIVYLVEKRCSLCRFGDGEFKLAMNYAMKFPNAQGIGFQEYDDELGRRLYEILSAKSDYYMIGLPSPLFGYNLNRMTIFAKQYWKRQAANYIDWLYLNVPRSQLFLDSFFTRFYIDYRNHNNCSAYIQDLKKIWEKRSLLIVEGLLTRLGVGNDLFDNAESIKRIICPPINAFSRIDEIETAIKQYAKENMLVLVALGPTATVITADMAVQGIQTIDIGHIDIEYEWMLRNATEKIPIPGKFVNEARSENDLASFSSTEYNSQIITTI